MRFRDRIDAGRQLVQRLDAYANREDVVVLGIPRGGVAVAFEVAQALHVPLDVLLVRKLGVPGQEELAFGAIAARGGRYLDPRVIAAADVSAQEIERVTLEASKTLQQRAVLYRGDRPPLQVTGKTVLLVDDGVATGASVYAAIQALREMKPASLVLAVPVAPATTCAWLKTEVDQFVCVYAPEQFYAVGEFYAWFPQVGDDEVRDLLRRGEGLSTAGNFATESSWNASEREVSIELDDVRLEGILSIPEDTKGMVLFVHGSGSSRHSQRNRYVAHELQAYGMGTLLFDLLTSEEEFLDRTTAEFRFDIELLTRRLLGVTEWVTRHRAAQTLPIGYFGASTGAAAALAAAAQLRGRIATVVSRGGRPDLAGSVLGSVRVPVLLIVGGNDARVLGLNRQALQRLASQDRQLEVIPGATHLFEEAGALEKVAQLATDWFARIFTAQGSRQEPSVS